MKTLSRVGLVIFYVGVIAFIVRQVKPDLLKGVDDVYIDVAWPAGLLVYAVCKALIKNKNN